MVNLLPAQYKNELKQEKNWKIVAILGIVLLAIFISFSLILYAINIFLEGEINYQAIIYEQKEKELINPKMQSLQENLIAFNQTFASLDSFYGQQLKMVRILEDISSLIPPEVYLTNLSLKPDRQNKEKIECLLAGFSPQRDILLNFKENLEKQDNLEEVYFPPASWIKPDNINFTVNFKINFSLN